MMTRFLYNRPFPFLSPDDGAGQGADPAGQAPAAPAAEPTAPKAQETPKTLDDVLADKAMQAEFDRRVKKALETNRAKWEKEQAMTAQELATQQHQERTAELDKREAELNQRVRRATALESLGQKGLPAALADALDYTDDKTVTASIDKVEKAFRAAVDAAVADKLKGAPPKDDKGGADPMAAIRSAMGLK